MKFEKTKFKDLINSEGAILEIVEDLECSYYLKAFCLNGNGYIYSKLNKETLKAYFENKMTLKQLYLLGINEIYFVKTKSEIPPVIKPMRFEANDSIFETLECGNKLYNELPKGMILENPIEEIIDKL